MAQAVTPVKDRQLNIEESIIEPMVNKWLKYAGALMSANEDKYILITGSEPRWVQVTKGLLTGKIKLEDLYVAEIIDDEDLEFMVQELLEQGKDPETEIVIDTDWIVRVETGSLAEIDTEQELENLQSWAKFAIEMGQQIDTKKVAIEAALRANIKEPEQYLLDAEEQPQIDPNTGQPIMPQQEGQMPVAPQEQQLPPAPPLFG